MAARRQSAAARPVSDNDSSSGVANMWCADLYMCCDAAVQGAAEHNNILNEVPEDNLDAVDPELTTEELIADKQQVGGWLAPTCICQYWQAQPQSGFKCARTAAAHM